MRAAAVPAGLAVLALLAAGCGPGRDGGVGVGAVTLAQARAFDDFPLYYAGESVDGLTLEAVVRRDDTARYVSFVYGDCTPATSDLGCAPPAEIQVWPSTSRDLALYSSTAPGSPEPELTSVGGVPGAFFDDGTRLELFTSKATVVVFAESRARVLRLARKLECVASPGTPIGTAGC